MRWILFALLLAGCTFGFDPDTTTPVGLEPELATVVRVIDGDTIDVTLPGQSEPVRIRYVGMNTPERDEPCYRDATDANRALVEGQAVRLEVDQTDTDRFGRLLRYIYVGDTLVNEQLVAQGYAEVVSYPPDDRFFDRFRTLEDEARAANRGCHPTGIFDDGTYTR